MIIFSKVYNLTYLGELEARSQFNLVAPAVKCAP